MVQLELVQLLQESWEEFSGALQDLGIQLAGRDCKPLKAVEKIKELHQSAQLESKLGDYVKFAYGV